MFVKNWSSQLDPALIYLPLSTAILRWTSVLAPQTCRSRQPFDSIWRELWLPQLAVPHHEDERPPLHSERPNLFGNQKQLCEQLDVLLQKLENRIDGPGVNRAGFELQGGNKPFFPTAPTVPKFMQPAAGRADTKAIAPQTPASVQLSLTAAPGTSWILRTWPDWTRRGRELWGKIWGGGYFWF